MGHGIGGERDTTSVTQTMGFSEPDRIVVRGLDLCEQVIGVLDFGQMVFLELVGRTPSTAEARIVNAVLVTLVEHGVTPSALATRLTALGAPDSLQGSVAAGLLGVGGRLVGAVEESARLYQELGAVEQPALADAIARRVEQARASAQRIPGIGHPLHKPVDPRTVRLFALADELGFDRRHRRVAELVQAEAERSYSRVLPLNVDGAIGAVLSDVGFPWQCCRSFAVIARAAGLASHALEESRNATATAVWQRAEAELTYRDPEPLF